MQDYNREVEDYRDRNKEKIQRQLKIGKYVRLNLYVCILLKIDEYFLNSLTQLVIKWQKND